MLANKSLDGQAIRGPRLERGRVAVHLSEDQLKLLVDDRTRNDFASINHTENIEIFIQ